MYSIVGLMSFSSSVYYASNASAPPRRRPRAIT